MPPKGGTTNVTAEKVFAPQSLTVAAGKEQVVKLAEPWANPKLWWPDDPQMYRVVTKVLLGGKVVDVRRTPFGFRQWEWDSPQFKLNGLPWNLRGDTAAGVDGFSQGTVRGNRGLLPPVRPEPYPLLEPAGERRPGEVAGAWTSWTPTA